MDGLCLSGDGPSAADSSELVLEAASIACRADRISDSGSEWRLVKPAISSLNKSDKAPGLAAVGCWLPSCS